MEEKYIYTDSFSVGYHGVPLIKDIALSMKKGEILTLIGPNGAGKTTILKSLIRQLAPIGGYAYLNGESIHKMKGEDLSKQMAVVLTERVTPEMMTCRDIVATGRYPYTGRFGLLSDHDNEVVDEAMDLVHITELADRDFLKTSDGQKQRVMLARAICQEAELIVLDEPTSFLDIRYKLEFLSIIQNMSKSKQLSVIMSLHELDLAGRISDKIACVKGDRIDRFGSPEEIFTEGYIPELYGMTIGAYEERSGNLEMNPVLGYAKILVLAGNGTGTNVFRRLQREGVPFATGILWENDLDYPSAKALASELVSEKAFSRISSDKVRRMKELIDQVDQVILTLDESMVGEFYLEFKEILTYAREQDKVVDYIH